MKASMARVEGVKEDWHKMKVAEDVVRAMQDLGRSLKE